jgi:hypothetical protein
LLETEENGLTLTATHIDTPPARKPFHETPILVSAPKMAGNMARMMSSMRREVPRSAIMTLCVVLLSWLCEVVKVVEAEVGFCEAGEWVEGEEEGCDCDSFWLTFLCWSWGAAFADPEAFAPIASASILKRSRLCDVRLCSYD